SLEQWCSVMGMYVWITATRLKGLDVRAADYAALNLLASQTTLAISQAFFRRIKRLIKELKTLSGIQEAKYAKRYRYKHNGAMLAYDAAFYAQNDAMFAEALFKNMFKSDPTKGTPTRIQTL